MFLCTALLFAGPLAVGASAAPAAPSPAELALHRRAVVVDTHADTTQRIKAGVDISRAQPDLHLDLVKMKTGGLDAEFFSIFVNPGETPKSESFAEALRQFAAVHALVKANPKVIAWAQTADDVVNNERRGLLSALFGVEGGHALWPGGPDEQLAHLRQFFTLGARYMTLTWANSNDIGGSSGDEGDGLGLTDFGRRVVDEMQRLGMVIDVSHVSDPLFWDVIRYVKKPVLASHSSARALTNVPRNMTDAMLKAVAKNGGAVCVNYSAIFLDDAAQKAWRLQMPALAKLPQAEHLAFLRAAGGKLPPVPLSALIDHIEHMIEVAGVDHVCLGSDFDGVFALPVGLQNAAQLPALTHELRQRGHSEDDVLKILGGNTLRVLRANHGP